MSCVHSTPAQGRSRGRIPLFLIQEHPRLPGFPSDVYGIMTQRSDSARPRPYAELDQALHTLGGYVLLIQLYFILLSLYYSVYTTQFILSENTELQPVIMVIIYITNVLDWIEAERGLREAQRD